MDKDIKDTPWGAQMLTGAVVIHPGDKLILAFNRRMTMEEYRYIQEHLKPHLPEVHLILIDDVQFMAVVKMPQLKYDAPPVEQYDWMGYKTEHNWSMPHKIENGTLRECPPNCPVELAKQKEHAPPSYYDMATAPFMGNAQEYANKLAAEQKLKEHAAQGLMTSEEYAKSQFILKSGQCRRCLRTPGGTSMIDLNPPCGDCPDFAEHQQEEENK